MRTYKFVAAVLSFVLTSPAYGTQPIWSVTPGETCSASDPDFEGYQYPDEVARCRRHVTTAQRKAIAKAYGIPKSEWKDYQFDHLIPLCAGGSNADENLWYQPNAEAEGKDLLENQVCLALRKGKITQEQAIARVMQWMEAQ
jgi:hypothetical protein